MLYNITKTKKGFVSRDLACPSKHFYRYDTFFFNINKNTYEQYAWLTQWQKCVLFPVFIKASMIFVGDQIYNPKTRQFA